MIEFFMLLLVHINSNLIAMTKYLLLVATVIVMSLNCIAQDLNKTVFDEKSQANILIGYCDRSGLMTGDFGLSFTEEHTAYRPNDSVLNALKYKLDDISFTIVLGAWCGDSKEQVPRFIKLLDCLKYDLSKAAFIAVDRAKTAGNIPLAELKIEKVPTFIVIKSGAEIGRITETPEASLEKDLLKIISQ